MADISGDGRVLRWLMSKMGAKHAQVSPSPGGTAQTNALNYQETLSRRCDFTQVHSPTSAWHRERTMMHV